MTTRLIAPIARWLLALMALAGSLAAQAAAPETPASRQLTRWLETFNQGDRAVRLAFLEEHFPSRARAIDQDLAFRERTAGFDLIRFTEATPSRAVAILKERDSETAGVRITVEVAAEPPHRIASVAFQPGVSLGITIARLGDAELASVVKAEAERREKAGRFSGAVMVARKGKPVVSGAWGFADREKGGRNRVETRFRNGSMNKMFTAVAIMTLVQDGKVALDAPLGTYLKAYPNTQVATKVTIHHLLTHTGGTGDIFGPEFTTHRNELRTHDDYLALYGKRDLDFEPGSRWDYSNYGFVLLGLVIEKVTGKSYYDYVRERVFLPAGMTRTDAEPENVAVADRSVGYMKAPGSQTLERNDETLPYRGTAAGGGYTTVGDLIRFGTALIEHKLLDARHTDILLTGKTTTNGGDYAYGFYVRNVNGARSVGHGGGAPGMNGDLYVFPESGYVVAALTNLDPPTAQRMAAFVANRVQAGGSTP